MFCAPGGIRTPVGRSPRGLQPRAFDRSATGATGLVYRNLIAAARFTRNVEREKCIRLRRTHFRAEERAKVKATGLAPAYLYVLIAG